MKKIIILLIVCLFILTLHLSILKAKHSQNKPLTELIFTNPAINTIKIYRDSINGIAYYSIDFNDSIGYDYLDEDSLKLAITAFPKSIYKNE